MIWKRSLLAMNLTSCWFLKFYLKNHSVFVNAGSLMISGYDSYLNFNSNADTLSTLGIRGVGIFVSKKIPAVQCI